MRTFLAVVPTYLVLGCTAPEEHQHDQLMDRVESQVTLPQGAGRLSEYARHYALDDKGNVVGVYVAGHQSSNSDETCEEVLENFATREVPCAESESAPLPVGRRQWVGDTDGLPLVLDGGCSVITVSFDPKTDEVKSAICNGVA